MLTQGVALQWALGSVASLFGRSADRIERGLAASESWFEPMPKIHPGYFLLGVTILGSVLYVIVRNYLPLYTEAVATVTHLPPRESAGLAMWLVLLTALLGIFIELAVRFSSVEGHTNPLPPQGTSNEQVSRNPAQLENNRGADF